MARDPPDYTQRVMIAERVAIFIDGSNLYHGLKANIGRTDLDYGRFAAKICGSRQLLRLYYYNAPVDQTRDHQGYVEQQKFFARLRQTPYVTVKLGRLVYRQGVPIEKGIDIKIATDLLRLAYQNTYDTAILVTGDGDFADAVEAAKDLGKHVEGAYFRMGFSNHLREACDRIQLLDADFLNDCWVKRTGG